ncbi:unnamed protein product, partial [Acanthoscelides obtectus]
GKTCTWPSQPSCIVSQATTRINIASEDRDGDGPTPSQNPRPGAHDDGNGDNKDIEILLPYIERSCPLCLKRSINILHMTLNDEIKHVKSDHKDIQIRFKCRMCSKMYIAKHAALCHVPKCPVGAAAAAPPPESTDSETDGVPSNRPIPESVGVACPDCGERYSGRGALTQHQRHRHPLTRNEARAAGTRRSPRQRRLVIFTEEEEQIMMECELRYRGELRIAMRMRELIPEKTLKQLRDKRAQKCYKERRERYLAERGITASASTDDDSTEPVSTDTGDGRATVPQEEAPETNSCEEAGVGVAPLSQSRSYSTYQQ